MITAEKIKRLASQGEGKYVDFKRSVPAKVRELTEEVCSFVNTDGGYVLIGIDNQNQIIGAEIDNNTRSAIYGSIGEVSPSLHFDLYRVDVDGKAVWVIDVPAGINKPYIFSGVIFTREGANCQKLTQIDDIRQFFQQNDKVYFDAIPMRGVELLGQVDSANYEEFRREAGISNGIDQQQVLHNLQLFDDTGKAKRGGILFFSSHPEQYFFQAVTRCVHFKGLDKVYILDDKTFRGPLLQQYKQAVEWIQNKISVNYIIEGTGPRREVWEVPLAVFKEAILNALCHRDYYEQGATICIEIYDDRVEISNPGGLLPLVAQDFGRRSLTRNPLVFSLFTRMHLVEHIGSGIMRMRQEMLSAGLPEPHFSTEGFFTVTLSRKPQATVSTTGEQSGETPNALQKIVRFLKANGPATTAEIIQASGLKKTAVYSHLKKLVTMQRVQKNINGLWIANE